MSAIMTCTCVHPFQDKEYGRGKRLFNEGIKDKWRCTVCGREIITSRPVIDSSKKKENTKSKKGKKK